MNCAKHTDVVASAYCRTCGKALCANCMRDVQGTIFCEDCLAERLRTPAAQPSAAPPPPPVGEGSPGLAAVLGFIPGVGAMYNGQFAKAFVHVMVFATLIWLADHGGDSLQVFAGLGIAAWYFYMIFDAYTTAKARKHGLPLPDPLGISRLVSPHEPAMMQQMNSAGERIGQSMESAVGDIRARMSQPGAPGYVQPTTAASEYYQQPVAVRENYRDNGPVGAIVLIGLGCLFLLDNLGVFRFSWMSRFWPLVLIILGVWLFIRRTTARAQ